MSEWVMYIIEDKRGSFYTGITANIERRLKEHQQKISPLDIHANVSLLYTEFFSDQFQTAKREKQIKGWTRRKKLALIAGDFKLLKKL